jgi:AhpD family alkylhydroperoxidase
MKRWLFWIVGCIVAAFGDWSMAQERQPKPIPVDRAQAKRALEALKDRQPRLPLAPPTEEEKQSWGVQAIVINGLSRRRYLPETWFAADFGQDPMMLLEYPLKTKCFWVVSRANNCQYCLGHQEHKLTAIGMTDAQLAGLDAGGPGEDARTRACLEAARKITLAPHLWSVSDLELLREQMTDEQVIEIVYTISMFNSVNRWTDSLGLPQDRVFRGESRSFVTEDLAGDRLASKIIQGLPKDRGALPSWDSVVGSKAGWKILLPEFERAGRTLGRKVEGDWERAMSLFPEVGTKQIVSIESILKGGDLSPELVARIGWICARHNRADAMARFWLARWNTLGQPKGELERAEVAGSEDVAIRQVELFAKRLTVQPQSIVDEDIEALRAHFTDRQTAQIVYAIGACNLLDRFTRCLGMEMLPEGANSP